jgi:hypothetical protein
MTIRGAHDREEGSVSGSDLLVLAPWVVFLAGVAALALLAVTRNHSRRGRRRRRR